MTGTRWEWWWLPLGAALLMLGWSLMVICTVATQRARVAVHRRRALDRIAADARRARIHRKALTRAR
jgi:hypothetical protein